MLTFMLSHFCLTPSFSDLPKTDFRGYLVELEDPSGCNANPSIKGHQVFLNHTTCCKLI